MPGYMALHKSAAWLDISPRGRIRAVGEDRLRLLHAIASNPVEGLQAGQGTYAFFLNAQGRIQADSRIFVCKDHVLIDCEPEVRQALLEHIESYIIMDDVQLEDLAESTAALALEGPRSEEIARQAFDGPWPDPVPRSHRESNGLHILRSTLSGQAGLWFVCPPSRKRQLVEKLEAAGAEPASEDDFRVVRVENRVPRFGEDYSSSNIPHETGLLQAVSFTKGCYLGQEIVERVRSQGQVNKLLISLELNTREPPPTGTAVQYDDREVGRLSSPVFSPRLKKVMAFAILRREATEPGAKVAAAGVSGRVLAVG
jgi:folate-binding protein YgfZ